MTDPGQAPQTQDGADVVLKPGDLEDPPTPATSDPDEMTDDGDLGGVAGQGGAG